MKSHGSRKQEMGKNQEKMVLVKRIWLSVPRFLIRYLNIIKPVVFGNPGSLSGNVEQNFERPIHSQDVGEALSQHNL